MKKRHLKKYFIIIFTLLLVPIIHLWTVLGPFISLLAFPFYLLPRNKTKIVDKILKAFSVSLLALFISIFCAYLVSIEYKLVNQYCPRPHPEMISFYSNYDNQIYKTGEIFPVVIGVDNIVQPINTIGVNLKYQTKYLNIIEISIKNSLATVFIDKSINNIDGYAFLSGGLPNPGYFEKKGEFATFWFLAKKAGDTKIEVLNSSQILANDGSGKNLAKKEPFTIPISISTQLKEQTDKNLQSLEAQIENETVDSKKLYLFDNDEIFSPNFKPVGYYCLFIPNDFFIKILKLDEFILSQYRSFSFLFLVNY